MYSSLPDVPRLNTDLCLIQWLLTLDKALLPNHMPLWLVDTWRFKKTYIEDHLWFWFFSICTYLASFPALRNHLLVYQPAYLSWTPACWLSETSLPPCYWCIAFVVIKGYKVLNVHFKKKYYQLDNPKLASISGLFFLLAICDFLSIIKYSFSQF